MKELQEAVESTLKKHRWEIGLFSEAKRVVARKKAVVSKKKQKIDAMLEAEIIFQQDIRKTDLLIKITDVDAKLGDEINKQARQMRQDILEELPGPD